ncbi:hypothetical protein CLOM_g4641 [Closterium sp. NIES-68]|nr:hypothetical protein CLOM_g4641 [Closterium sp. NIES-68]GJP85769.1 hypothetical protein CLOP_g15868 [Closterium sp. NIES-67]
MARTRFASTLPSALPSGLSWARPSLLLRLFVAASPLLPEAYLVEGDRVEGDRVKGDRVEGDRVKGDLVEGDRVEGDRVAQFPDCPLTGRRRRPKKNPGTPAWAILSPLLCLLLLLLPSVAASPLPLGYRVEEYPDCPLTGRQPEYIAAFPAVEPGPGSPRRCFSEDDDRTCCGPCGGWELGLRYVQSNVSLVFDAFGGPAAAGIDPANPPTACQALQGYPLCAHLLEMVMCVATCNADTEFVVKEPDEGPVPTISICEELADRLKESCAGTLCDICEELADRLKESCAGTLFGRINTTMDSYAFTTEVVTAIGRQLFGIPGFTAVISFSGGCLVGPQGQEGFPNTFCCDPFNFDPSQCPVAFLSNTFAETHPHEDHVNHSTSKNFAETYAGYLNRSINATQCMAAEPYAYASPIFMRIPPITPHPRFLISSAGLGLVTLGLCCWVSLHYFCRQPHLRKHF